MSPEAQRIAIAEACGIKWRIEEIYAEDVGNPDAPKWVRFEYPNGTGKCDYSIESGFPSYLTDLNAMHEAEKVLLDKGDNWTEKYYYWLGEIGTHPMFHCSAAQRAEAFLRTLNLWKPTP